MCVCACRCVCVLVCVGRYERHQGSVHVQMILHGKENGCKVVTLWYTVSHKKQMSLESGLNPETVFDPLTLSGALFQRFDYDKLVLIL